MSCILTKLISSSLSLEKSNAASIFQHLENCVHKNSLQFRRAGKITPFVLRFFTLLYEESVYEWCYFPGSRVFLPIHDFFIISNLGFLTGQVTYFLVKIWYSSCLEVALFLVKIWYTTFNKNGPIIYVHGSENVLNV